MKTKVLVAALAALLAVPAQAEIRSCQPVSCATTYVFSSSSETRSYGLLLAAPAVGCRHVRFRIEMAGHRLLGQTPPLRPGERAIVRMGRGFANGKHVLTITPEGCAAVPAMTRRVGLAKSSPDHESRAAAAEAL